MSEEEKEAMESINVPEGGVEASFAKFCIGCRGLYKFGKKVWNKARAKHLVAAFAIYLATDGGLNHFRIWNFVWSPVTSHSARVVQDSVSKVSGFGMRHRASDSAIRADLSYLKIMADSGAKTDSVIKCAVTYLAFKTGNSNGLRRRLDPHPPSQEPNVFPKNNQSTGSDKLGDLFHHFSTLDGPEIVRAKGQLTQITKGDSCEKRN